jgi:hypothetical protein
VGGLKPRCRGGASKLWWETILTVLIVQDHGRNLVRRFSYPKVYIIISIKHLLTIERDSTHTMQFRLIGAAWKMDRSAVIQIEKLTAMVGGFSMIKN